MSLAQPLPQADESTTHRHDLVIVGASAGGIAAISTLLSGLPADLKAAVLVVLHMAADAGNYLPKMFGDASPLPVNFAEDGLPLAVGEVRIAPPDRHLLVEPGLMRVTRGPRENRFRPAIDPTFRSAAWSYGPRVVGILLSGMMSDGSAGLWAIKTCGGVTVVQDPADARYSDMPQHAVDTLPVDHCLPVVRIAPLVAELAQQPAPGVGRFQPPEQLRIETRMASHRDHNEIAEMNRIGKLSPFTCPSCHGSLWEVFDDHVLRFRCHTGHAFSADSLDAELGEDYENALFGALRALEENARLARSIAKRSRQSKHEHVAKIYEDKADDNDRSANVIRSILQRGRVARDTAM
jgi:two-component system chemotaxis response regulator CheB